MHTFAYIHAWTGPTRTLCSALEAEGGQSDFFGLDSCPKNNTPVDQNRLADT